MNLKIRIQKVSSNVKVRHYHSIPIKSSNVRLVQLLNTARPSAMQQAFNQACQ